MNARFHDQADRGGLGFNQQLFASLVPFDAWTFLPAPGTGVVPDGAVSVVFGLDLVQETPDFPAYFDAAGLQLVPEPRSLLLLAAGIALSAAHHRRPHASLGR